MVFLRTYFYKTKFMKDLLLKLKVILKSIANFSLFGRKEIVE